MLEKEISTDVGVPAKYWKTSGYMYSLFERKGFIEMAGYATKDAEKPIASVKVSIGESHLLSIDELEAVVKTEDAWQNLK